MTTPHRKPVIGILGGVGAGKSTAAKEFARFGCGLIDADAIGHELLADPAVKAEFHRLWGDRAFHADGTVNRPAVAEVAFASPEAVEALNAVMHPRIRKAIAERLEALQGDPAVPAIVLDAALLLETDWQEFCTVFVFVSAPEQARAERACREKGWDLAAWRRRENSQKPLDIKAARAEYVLDNSSSLSCLREQIRSILHRWLQRAGRP